MEELTKDNSLHTEDCETQTNSEQADNCCADINAAASDMNADTAEPDASTADINLDTNVNPADADVNTNAEADKDGSTSAKSKPLLIQKVQKFFEYLNEHEDMRQMVFFLMFSVLCGLSQMVVTYALSAGLKLASGLGSNFNWFVFHFATTAEFIGFLVGSVVGQVLTFVLNRKKTFNMPNYLVMRAIMYTGLAILIIIMQTYLGGVVTSACYKAAPNAGGFLALLFNLTGQAVAGIAAVIVNFLGNKFLVMRDWGKKIAQSEAENKVVDCTAEEQVEA